MKWRSSGGHFSLGHRSRLSRQSERSLCDGVEHHLIGAASDVGTWRTKYERQPVVSPFCIRLCGHSGSEKASDQVGRRGEVTGDQQFPDPGCARQQRVRSQAQSPNDSLSTWLPYASCSNQLAPVEPPDRGSARQFRQGSHPIGARDLCQAPGPVTLALGDGGSLPGQRRHSYLPTLSDLSKTETVGDRDVIEEDLVERFFPIHLT